ncbi:hypothetical protein D3C87_1286080 [compost metagenome]
MLNERVGGKADFATQACGLRPGLDALELIAFIQVNLLNAIQSPHEVKMPPGTPEFTIRHRFEADSLLLLYELRNLLIFDLLQLFC